MIDGLAELVAIVSCDGTILMINQHWQRVMDEQGGPFLVGRSYQGALRDLIEAGDARVKPILEAFDDVRASTRQSFECVYVGAGVFTGHDYSVRFSRIESGGIHQVLVSVVDLTEVNALKRERRRMGAQVLHVQEAERKRIARELHDSTSQLLLVLQFNLMNLKRASDDLKSDPLFADCMDALADVHSEIRSLSFLAHPPSLEANGLPKALQALVTGFGNRTGIAIDMQVSDVDQVSASVELTLYRLAQESLANIHRHSGAESATVRLIGGKRFVYLTASDDGIGFPPAQTLKHQSMGVGILGMAERVRELGGRFSIRRSPKKGTVLKAILPRL
jgi:two-component system NarL family sensor kinase